MSNLYFNFYYISFILTLKIPEQEYFTLHLVTRVVCTQRRKVKIPQKVVEKYSSMCFVLSSLHHDCNTSVSSQRDLNFLLGTFNLLIAE